MYIKGNKFYADWTDAEGHRRRKSFTTAKAALSYQAEQRNAVPRRAGRQSRQSSSPSQSATKKATATSNARPASSSRKQVHSGPKTCAPPTVTKSMPHSATRDTLTAPGATRPTKSYASSGGSHATTARKILGKLSTNTRASGQETSLPRRPRSAGYSTPRQRT